MPHGHAAAVVDRLLRRLGSAACRLEVPPNIDGDLAHVWTTLARLQDMLVSLEIRPELQEWMGDIKQVAYDVEDLVDELEDHNSMESQMSGCVAVGEETRWCCSCSFLMHSTRADRMKTIKRRLDFLVKDSVIFSLMQYPFPDVERFDNEAFDRAAVVGRDNDKAKIKDMILQSNAQKFSIIPILGLVGLGKTTLARLIFLDQGEGWDFDLRIWISLNRKLNIKMIASDIISQCNHREEKLLDVRTDMEIQENFQLLKRCLQEALHEKHCLIVLDDLSSTDKNQLDELKEMLKGTNESIKVLVTTSSEITAELLHTIPPYKLCPLSEDDSWKIFSQKAFGNCDGDNTDLKKIGKEIVKRCEGIPLLTHSLGLVVQNEVTNVWLAARDEEIWKLERRVATKIELFSPLYQIYNDFSSTIKLCFLYLSIFPKGSTIDKEKLIQQWIALEIIGSKHDSLPPYVNGEMCIQDFLSIYFLQVRDTHSSTFSHSTLTRTRALHIMNSEAITFPREAFELLKHLRVLNLSGCCIEELPASIGCLKRLKYLDVSGVQIQTLPFPNLKYLNMQGCDKLQNLPLSLGHLQRLEQLRLSCCRCIAMLPDSLCNLINLRILDLSRCTMLRHLPALFGNLVNLEDLSLSSCFNLKQLPESFGNLYFLRFLNLSSCYELQQFPESVTNLEKLEVLILRRCCRLRILPPSFAMIKYLRILDLAGCEALHVSTEMLTTNLEYLNLQRCLNLQTQPYYFENFNKLKFLNLSHCLPTVDCLESISYLFNLEYLDLSETSLDIPMSFARLQKLHTLNLTGCAPMHPSSNVHQTWPGILAKITSLKSVLTMDPVLAASLQGHTECSADYDYHSLTTTDELVIKEITGGSRGLRIAEQLNLQNRLEVCFLKLEWVPRSQSAQDQLLEYTDEEVLEKFQPNETLEHFMLVKYTGNVFPTWMMNKLTSLPYLVNLCLFHLHNCSALPPIGHLQNLRYLHIKDMPNLTNLEMGLSGGPVSLGKLTHLKLEALNLEELSILLSANNESPCFMFPNLEELSVLSCSKLVFKPSVPKCAKYVIKESNMVLSCWQPLGPFSSPPIEKVEISGCVMPSGWLQWLRSIQTLEKVVIDGEALSSFELQKIYAFQEASGSKISKETDGALKAIGIDNSTIKHIPRFNTTSELSG
ncbi:Pi15 [Zea mays]|uniref:Pi15 n=1 Tax=Zea mays TaxID=4577 RepID=A0A1D6I276_MAIZE|nr:Pi15 [Zea mays]